jgi:KRAB domain-containing zinc finger protein
MSKSLILKMYLVHQVVHTDDRPHGCNLCSKQFKSTQKLKQHVKVVHTKRTKEFTCLECNKAFFTKSDLNRHQNIHNREGFSKCYFCYKKFSQSGHLVTHMRLHTLEQPFICKEKFCTYSSADLSNLKEHQGRYHSSISTSNRVANDRIWTCYFCTKTDRQFSSLIIHMRQHTKEVPFKCNFCKKKYISQGSLTLHIATHTNEKPFKCSQCNKEFKQSGELKSHMVTHTKEKRYFCQFCSYGSYFRRSLREHISKRHTM